MFLARDGEDVLGMASFSLLWPAAGADTSAWLKELYVRSEARGRGVGRALIDAVRTAAQELGCTRLEWTADTGNPSALGFYEALGVPVDEGKAVYGLPF